MQQIPFIDLFIGLFEFALHVSGDKLAHLQEHFLTVYTVLVQCTDIAVPRPATPVGSNIGALLHHVGCLHRCVYWSSCKVPVIRVRFLMKCEISGHIFEKMLVYLTL